MTLSVFFTSLTLRYVVLQVVGVSRRQAAVPAVPFTRLKSFLISLQSVVDVGMSDEFEVVSVGPTKVLSPRRKL